MPTTTDTTFNVRKLRAEFPILEREVNGRPLVYLDNAATAQKPRVVIDAVQEYYRRYNANVHRGVHQLAQEATAAYERARETVARYLGAGDAREIVFTRGATESINLIASSLGRARLREGDEVVITEMEHHSNIVPWQLIGEQTGAVIRAVPVTDEGALDMDALERLVGARTRIVSVAHISNVLGTINPIARIAEIVHAAGAVFVVDGAQGMQHLPVDVRALGCDFYVFTGHKMFGPTGIGGLFGRSELLASMPPYQGGGEMIRSVSLAGSTYADPPARFEAGTPNIAGAVGLAAAIEYLRGLDLDAVAAHEQRLIVRATEGLAALPGARLFGTVPGKVAMATFTLGDIHPHDIGTVLDHEGVAVRTGHHCAQPLMDRFGVTATARASFSMYNTTEEVDALIAGLGTVLEVFS